MSTKNVISLFVYAGKFTTCVQNDRCFEWWLVTGYVSYALFSAVETLADVAVASQLIDVTNLRLGHKMSALLQLRFLIDC